MMNLLRIYLIITSITIMAASLYMDEDGEYLPIVIFIFGPMFLYLIF